MSEPQLWASNRPINFSPTLTQPAAVSEIKSLLVGVERLILAPQLAQIIASFLTSTVTIFSVCCAHLEQRIRRIVRSAVENFIQFPNCAMQHGTQSTILDGTIEFLVVGLMGRAVLQGSLEAAFVAFACPVSAIRISPPYFIHLFNRTTIDCC